MVSVFPTVMNLMNITMLTTARTVIVDVRQLLDLMYVSASQAPVETATPTQASVSNLRSEDPVEPGQTMLQTLGHEGATLAALFLLMPEENIHVPSMTKTPNPNLVLVGMFG